ncbi:neuroepithelial cell-transforming gene 1 protein-like isoform X2 [Pomacea canaliculata]|nr:neuroepithelial cell-transforming gene 1 protein-like isoform X2 [Pomacea canaliculata]
MEADEDVALSSKLQKLTHRVPELKHNTRRLSWQSAMENPILRKRKRKDEDATSVQSLDVGSNTKSKKSRRSILRVSSSLVNLLSPSKPQKRNSSGFKMPNSPAAKQCISPYKIPSPSPAQRRLTRTWSDMMAGGSSVASMTPQDIKRQEAIYELYQGEIDIVEDLNNVKKLYRDSMLTLHLCTAGELSQIFGPIDDLLPVHEDLAQRLQRQRQTDGTMQGVGQQILQWVPKLVVYTNFCANQVFGKALLDEKRSDPAIDDFLRRCQESPFSRKLDLWGLLDGARGRFIKYPLLIKSILKETPHDNEDAPLLKQALEQLDLIIQTADTCTGEAECSFYKSRLVYIYDEQRVPEIEESKVLMCHGHLRNNKGSKLQLFLFEKVAVVTRPSSQGPQVYRQPIPVTHLVVEDLPDGEIKIGSFRNAFGPGQTAKNVLRVSFTDSKMGQSHTLMANDEHDKRQWMQSFQAVTSHIVKVGLSIDRDKK